MFMVVSYPWPVASANVELAGLWPGRNWSTRDIPRRDVKVQPELVGAGQAR
jgi:hypothetical protein